MSLDQKTNSKITTCNVQDWFIVNMINAQLHIRHVNRSPFPGQKVSEHEASHSPPARTELKICGAIPPLPICLQDKHCNSSISIMPLLNIQFAQLQTQRQCEKWKAKELVQAHNVSYCPAFGSKESNKTPQDTSFIILHNILKTWHWNVRCV